MQTNGLSMIFKNIVGKVVVSVVASDGDEGYKLTFDDGTILDIGYSSCEGVTYLTLPGENAQEVPSVLDTMMPQ
jgi:hypothetical protein